LKRQIVYAGQVPLETDLLNSNKNIMVAIGHVLQDMIGTSTLFSGLACVPTAPAGMTVNVNPGRAYSLQATDTGAYSSLSADARQVVKQGILLDAANFSCPAPTTAGFSVNYLIQGAFQEVDSGSLVLPYYNASNPSQAYNGPNGTGTSQTTARDNTVQLQLKAGVAATTGSQITPTPDAGFNGLWVVTVPFGASTITSANISQYSGAPFLTASLLSMIQQSGLYAVATGTANAHVAAFSPPITTRTDGMVLRYKAPAANTGALTFNDGLGAVAVVGAAHAALQGGETAVNGDVWLQWNSSIGGGSYVLIDSTGGAVQVAPATQSQHAVQLGQATGRLLAVTAFTSSGTWTPNALTTKVRVRILGGGGGGGGTGATASGQAACAGGGGGGAYHEIYIANPGSQTVTVGAAGLASGASASAGGNGGASSFGAIASAAGGNGGGAGAPFAPPGISGGGGAGGVLPTAVGGTVKRSAGATAGVGFAFGVGNVIGGWGAVSGDGGGGASQSNNSAGSSATSPGAGGAGASAFQSAPAASGGSGAAGYIIVEEFA
jgi:hypothetical protein